MTSDSDYEEYHGFDSGDESEASSSDPDVDRPRVAQWEDDEHSDAGSSSEESEQSRPSKSEDSALDIRNKLSSLSYSALLKARRSLARAGTNSDNEEDSESDAEIADDKDKSEPRASSSKDGHKATQQKRRNKHAPVESSAKIQVSRKKTIEVKKKVHRDPRFSALSGELSMNKFQSQYSFLADLHSDELSTLKENLTRAKKLLQSSPRDLREARELEVQRLEIALKRAESAVNKDRLDKVTNAAMGSLKKDEQEKRKKGKTGWWLKDSAKKELLLKARHDALVDSGGKAAVKKAIEKRQRKIGQKEKRSRPSFAPRTSSNDNGFSKKRPQTTNEANFRKRRKFS